MDQVDDTSNQMNELATDADEPDAISLSERPSERRWEEQPESERSARARLHTLTGAFGKRCAGMALVGFFCATCSFGRGQPRRIVLPCVAHPEQRCVWPHTCGPPSSVSHEYSRKRKRSSSGYRYPGFDRYAGSGRKGSNRCGTTSNGSGGTSSGGFLCAALQRREEGRGKEVRGWGVEDEMRGERNG